MQKNIQLSGMLRKVPEGLPGWKADWAIFGPVICEDDSSPWPGKIGFDPLPLDCAVAIPTQIEMHGEIFRARQAASHDGNLDLRRILHCTGDRPIAYIMTWIRATRPAILPISFGANCGTQWWMNGALVYETRMDFRDPDDRSSHQFEAPLQEGRNLLVARIIGSRTGCSITLSKVRSRASTGSVQQNKEKVSDRVGPKPAAQHRSKPTRDYCETGLRIEERPNPLVDSPTRERREKAMAAHGVEARWIGIVDETGSPYARSRFLPQRPGATLEDERRLKRQVQAIHAAGMTAMTWFPGSHCLSAAKEHPDWRTVCLGPSSLNEMVERNVCIHSPYGEALIGFVIESLDKLDLDGFWFDGAIWTHPGNIGCFCAYCRERFRREEGLDLPDKVDWSNSSFQRWVAWRYRAYMNFWGRLTAEVRRRFPQSRIVINHGHRFPYWSFPGTGPIESWLSAIPIDCHDADVIAGTEMAGTPLSSAFHSRLVRAYERPQAETWMGLHSLFNVYKNRPQEMHALNPFLHHAMACMTAGAMPSFGTPDPGDKPTFAYDALGALINPLKNYVGGTGEPYAALHLSQQSETFVFSRRSDGGFPWVYWRSVLGWHNLLCENQFLADVVFDGHLTPSRLHQWPVLIAPLSVALSDQQVRLFEEYVEAGGVLVAGPCLGACDEWGNPADPRRVEKLLGCLAEASPDPNEGAKQGAAVSLHRTGLGLSIVMGGDVGNRFYEKRSAVLCREVGRLIRSVAPPRVVVRGPRRLHVGMYRVHGVLRLFLHNFIAYSESQRFPNPKYVAPEPIEEITVQLRGYDIQSAQLVFPLDAPQPRVCRKGEVFQLTIPRIERGIVIEMTL